MFDYPNLAIFPRYNQLVRQSPNNYYIMYNRVNIEVYSTNI